MFISVSSSLDPALMSSEGRARLFRRKGGGAAAGGHGGGKGGGKGGKAGSNGSSRASDVARKHGASSTFLKSRSVQTFDIPGTKTSATAYADGGGKAITLKSDSALNGREAGGGSRGAIYGTSHFGSGYPYGGYGPFVSSRPFPFYFFPVPVSHGYYGGDEYLNVNDTKRPGGKLVTAVIQPANSSNNVVYRLVGDNSSVTTVFDALVANCSVANSSSAITTFSPSTTTWPLPEQIVQYYRASSFALSLDTYNNTATLLANAPASNDSVIAKILDTDLPSGLNMTFLECINSTIGASVPLADVSKGGKLSRGAVAGIAVACSGGVFLLLMLCSMCFGRGRKSGRTPSF